MCNIFTTVREKEFIINHCWHGVISRDNGVISKVGFRISFLAVNKRQYKYTFVFPVKTSEWTLFSKANSYCNRNKLLSSKATMEERLWQTKIQSYLEAFNSLNSFNSLISREIELETLERSSQYYTMVNKSHLFLKILCFRSQKHVNF